MEKKFHTQHKPVLLGAVLETLTLRPGYIVIDATLGGGGYTRAFLERVGESGKVIALDWDKEALERFRLAAAGEPRLEEALVHGNLILIQGSYAKMSAVCEELKLPRVDAIVADLGLSSDQLNDSERGLSFLTDAPLDMRLNSEEKVTAAAVLNEFSREELENVFRIYGDEPEAGRIARAIEKARLLKPMSRTLELRKLIEETVSKRRLYGRIHPATQVFQALRIAVNSERQALTDFLPQTLDVLKEGGEVAIVSFHSGEDALVKHFFQEEARGCTCGMVPCICGRKARLKILTKKPILPMEGEVSENPRSRSAKLRIARRIG